MKKKKKKHCNFIYEFICFKFKYFIILFKIKYILICYYYVSPLLKNLGSAPVSLSPNTKVCSLEIEHYRLLISHLIDAFSMSLTPTMCAFFHTCKILMIRGFQFLIFCFTCVFLLV